VGSWSDRTWTFLGRRRPFLIVGAILTAFALFFMPHSPSLLIAAALLWILDASINISQGPYRSLVPDTVPHEQQPFTYSLMAFTIGLGSVASSLVGYIVPDMHLLFYAGAVTMLAAMIWTMITTPEVQRPLDPEQKTPGFFAFLTQTWHSMQEMPVDIKKLCLAHSFTWFGLQCFFIFFSLYILQDLLPKSQTTAAWFGKPEQFVMLCFTAWNTVCFIASPLLGKLCNVVGKKPVHTFGLLCFAGGLLGTAMFTQPEQALIAMGVMGIGWASILSIPFAILASKIPPGREGVLMGTFNIFIAAPQFFASFLAGSLVAYTGYNVSALALGGVAILLSAFLLQWVRE
jgi:maltose/moltooligosaccharide transporter